MNRSYRSRAITSALVISALLGAGVLEARRPRHRDPSDIESASPSAGLGNRVSFKVVRFRGNDSLPTLIVDKSLQRRTSTSVLVDETWSNAENGEVLQLDASHRYELSLVDKLAAAPTTALGNLCDDAHGRVERLFLSGGARDACRIDYAESIDGRAGETSVWFGNGVFLAELQREWRASDGSASATYELLSDRNNP